MTTIGSEISKLRNKLSNTVGFDDDNLLASEELLYALLNDAGAIIYKRIKNSWNKIPDFMFSKYPVGLEEANEDVYACEDIPERCKILESVFTIPLPLYGRNKSSMRVYSNHVELPPYSTSNKYDSILSNMASYKIVNDKLRIYNNKVLKAVEVEGVWSDIMDWQTKKYCPSTDTTECYNLNELAYPLYSNPEYSSMAHEIIIKSLGITLNEGNQNQSH